MSKIGILLINVGTPTSLRPEDVGVYLKEFLMDKEVIDLPFLLRWILVNLIIVPSRKKKSAKKYRSIWTEHGSPLMHHSKSMRDELGLILGDNYLVKIGMRYGQPSIEKAFAEFQSNNIKKVIVIPLYPQYSRSTTESAVDKVVGVAESSKIDISIVPEFFRQECFLKAYVKLLLSFKSEYPDYYWVFSFHGLPAKQLLKQPGCKLTDECCLEGQATDKRCYRAQALWTARELAKRLELPSDMYEISFQSRLGAGQWLEPYTIDVLKDLLSKNKKKVIVVSPSFIADCLETLEELGIEMKNLFLERGGEDFVLAPSLNSLSWLDPLIKNSLN